MHYFYLLQSIKKPSEIYTGSTNNLRSRFNEHNQGKVFSTKRYLPWRLVYYEACLSEKDARLREQKFKKHGKGNQELKKRLKNSLKIFKKGEAKGLPLTFLAKKGEGFTLLEVLLSVAIIAVLAGISLPIYQSLQNKNDLDIAAGAAVQILRRAQILSQAVDGDTSWGARLQSGSVVLFKGTSWAGRDSNFDEVFEISPSLALSGLSEIVFSKFSGVPQTAGNINLTSVNNETRTITINSKGSVSY